MPSNIPVPTLSARGWVTAIPEKCDMLLAHFYASDVNQSYLYAGSIANVQGILRQHMHDIDSLRQDMRFKLENYFNRYFNHTIVEITDDRDTNTSNKITLRIHLMITDDGRFYDGSYQVSFVDSKFEKILNLNNTGSITQ